MTLYEYIRKNEDTIRALIHTGVMSPKYLLWLDMYEYVNARSRGKKKQRLSSTAIMKNASKVFSADKSTIFRACSAMKKTIDLPKTQRK